MRQLHFTGNLVLRLERLLLVWRFIHQADHTVSISVLGSTTSSAWWNALVRNWSAEMKEYYDTLSFRRRRLNGQDILKNIANNFGQKFLERNSAVKNLRNTVQESLVGSSVLPECCEMQESEVEEDDRFKQTVSKVACHKISKLAEEPSGYLSEKFQDACAKNLLQMPFLRWQYFASESGVTSLYPGVKVADCGSYDGRFRPFYVQANVPEPKDVVLVIDKSGSMAEHYKGRSLMTIAKEAAKTVVSTLNPYDRAAVIGFSDQIVAMGETNKKEKCFKTQLAQATGENIASLNQFIDEIKESGDTAYGIALNKAFDYFENTEVVGDRDRVILFLSDGRPRDLPDLSSSGKYIFGIIKKRNAKVGNSVILMTYAMGDEDFIILKHMAEQDGRPYGIENPDKEAIKPGLFTHVANPSDLRQEMGSYYSFFSSVPTKQMSSDPIWSLPYLDKAGIGLHMSVALPVHDKGGNLTGVVGTDLTLDDLLSGAKYFRPSELSYMFVIDSYGYVIYHPLFKYPEDHEVRYIDISAFETDRKMTSVIEDMKRGRSGTKTFRSERVGPGGSSQRYGIRIYKVTTEVHWRPILHSAFSVCVVLTKDDEESTLLRVDPLEGEEFLYHRFDLISPKNSCAHDKSYVAKNQSSISLGPRAFINTDAYLRDEESLEEIKAIESFMMSGRGGSSIKAGIRNSVWATQQADRFWRRNSESEFEKYVIWRYVGTKEGVMRLYPGSQLSKDFDPVVRPWYLNAVANKGRAAITPPYENAVGGRSVMSISKVIYEGRRNGEHNHLTDEVVAVMAVDMLVPYFTSHLSETFPVCFETGDYRCTLIDSAGFVLFRSTLSDHTSEVPLHLTQTDSHIAESLISHNIMVHSDCMMMEETWLQRTYEVVHTESYFGKTSDGCQAYLFIPIPRTNIFMIVWNADADCAQTSVCQCSRLPGKKRICVSLTESCECPCSLPYEKYNTCINKYDTKGNTTIPKPCTPAPKSVIKVEPNQEVMDNLPKCSNFPEGDTSSSPVLIGVIVAVVVVSLLLIVAGYFLWKRLNKKQRSIQDPLPPIPTVTATVDVPEEPEPEYESMDNYVNVTTAENRR